MKVFQRDKDVVSRKIAGELFLVPVAGNLADMERMFALTTVGEFIWERIDGRRSLSEIRDEVLAAFNVGEEQADSDIQEFLAEMTSTGLVQEVLP
jgi:hypothetical protein